MLRLICLLTLALLFALTAPVYATEPVKVEAGKTTTVVVSPAKAKDPACPCCEHCKCQACPLAAKRLPTGPVVGGTFYRHEVTTYSEGHARVGLFHRFKDRRSERQARREERRSHRWCR